MAKKGRSGCLKLVLLAVIVVAAIVALRERGNQSESDEAQQSRETPRQEQPTGRPSNGNTGTRREREEDLSATQQARAEPDESAPSPSGERSAHSEPQYTAGQEQYLQYARMYVVAAAAQGRTPPLMRIDEDDWLIGSVPGNFEVGQILNRSTMIANKIDGDGFPEYSVWVEGISTSGMVDEKKFGFHDDTTFRRAGTKSFVTVLGVTRTIYAIEVLDKQMLAWALSEVNRVAAERRRERTQQKEEALAAARDKLKDIDAQITRLKKDNERIAVHVQLTNRIRLYRDNMANKRVEPLLKEEEAKLKALGEVSEEDVTRYKRESASLSARRREAYRRLAELTE